MTKTLCALEHGKGEDGRREVVTSGFWRRFVKVFLSAGLPFRIFLSIFAADILNNRKKRRRKNDEGTFD
jgi:hypothetical protein